MKKPVRRKDETPEEFNERVREYILFKNQPETEAERKGGAFKISIIPFIVISFLVWWLTPLGIPYSLLIGFGVAVVIGLAYRGKKEDKNTPNYGRYHEVE